MPQARHDPIGVRYLIAAKPENVGRAGKLLCKGPAILLGKSGILNGNAANGRDRKAQGNRVHSHVRSFLSGFQLACLFQSRRRLQNKWGEGKDRAAQKFVRSGSRLVAEASFRGALKTRTRNLEIRRCPIADLRSVLHPEMTDPLLHLADLLHSRDQARGVLRDEF